MAPHLEKSYSVHQTVHGYRDGHRLLRSSCDLSAADFKTMLILSDVSGSGALIPEEGYITGYPLSGAGLYALAKTWNAKEIERPGSVWTHTLLIEFADLAAIDSLQDLKNYFRRPNPSNLKNDELFLQKKSVTISDSANLAATELELSKLKQLITALYKYPNQTVITGLHSKAEDLVFRIWRQQWPRLRRNFRFCTLSLSDRSLPKARFDLQFVPLNEVAISQFGKAIVAEKTSYSEEPWLDTAMKDLCSFERTKFQTFLRSVGSEILDGREAFVPLCEFYPILSNLTETYEAVDRAVHKLENEPELPSAIRLTVANAACNFVLEINDSSFRFLLHHLESVGIEQFKRNCGDIGKRYVRDHFREVFSALSSRGRLRIALDQAARAIPIDELLSHLRQDWSLANWLIDERSEILVEPKFWQFASQSTFNLISDIGANIDGALIVKAIVSAERIDLLSLAVEQFGAAIVLQGINLRLQEGHVHPSLYSWLDTCLADKDATAEFLVNAHGSKGELILAIAHHVDPSTVPCIENIDPWLKASYNIDDSLKYWELVYMRSFLLARGLRGSSCETSLLLARSFDTVYSSMELSRIPGDAWDLLSSLAPKRIWLVDWDKCGRLRSAIVDHFVEGLLPMTALITLTENMGLFKELVKSIVDSEDGRKAVKKILPNFSPTQKRAIRGLMKKLR